MDEIRTLVDSGRLDRLEQRMDQGSHELLNIGNYQYAAHRLGIIDHVVFVGNLDRSVIDRGQARATLVALQYPESDAESFEVREGLVTGELLGARFSLANLGDVGVLDEPVLLDIDTDLFPLLVQSGQYPSLEAALDQFALDLARTGLRSDVVTVAESIEWGFTPLEYSWLAEEVEAIVSAPRPEIPQARRELLQRRSEADALARRGEVKAARQLLEQILQELPKDPSTHAHLSKLARAELDLDEAEKHARLAAEASESHAGGLVDLAFHVGRTDLPRGLAILDAAEAHRAREAYVRGVRANLLFNHGRFDAAREQYERMEDDVRGVAMYTGDSLMMLGRYDEALDRYDRGLAALSAGNVESPESYAHSYALIGLYWEHVRDVPGVASTWYERYLESWPEGEARTSALARLTRWRESGLGPASAAR